jgi:hypothetical protein
MLNSTIAECDVLSKNISVGGISETYLNIEIVSKNDMHINAYIYADECMFNCDKKSYYFEKYDFDDEKDLIIAFVETISALMKGVEPTQKRSSRINIFKGNIL